jgi:hypothetical protein
LKEANMRMQVAAVFTTALFLSLAAAAGLAPGAGAATVTFSGTVSYQGSYSGDTLYVGVLDTTGVEDVTVLAIQAFPAGAPPFSQPYSLDFDNTGASSMLLVAAFLDVDGGGLDAISGADVFGWYAGTANPTGISSASSQSGIDFELPRAEIHGTITFAAGQSQARPNLSPTNCQMEGFRPTEWVTSGGPYSIIGIYPGTYCVSADGSLLMGNAHICYGDPLCGSPTLINLSATQVMTGVDLDFTGVAPVEALTWGRIKARYR